LSFYIFETKAGTPSLVKPINHWSNRIIIHHVYVKEIMTYRLIIVFTNVYTKFIF